MFSLALTSSLLLGWLLAPDDVLGCPPRTEVREELKTLLPEAEWREAQKLASWSHDEELLVLKLHSVDGQLLAEKEIPLDDDCQVLAQAVAVTLAVWAAQYKEDLTTPPPKPAETSPPPAAPRSGEEPEPAERRISFQALADVGLSSNENGAVMSATAGLGLVHRRWVLRLHGRAEAYRTIEASGGFVEYARPGLFVSVGRQFGPGWLTVEPLLGAGLSFVSVRGIGFDENLRTRAIEGVSVASLRLSFFRTALRPHLMGSLGFWPARQYGVVNTPQGPSLTRLSPFSGDVGIGLSFSF